ncbi:rhodanese-like domain-containing protein [Gottschalkia acidurici 9a]|uniref:Rhodanese-like domain-containing protein n=1 Tax=Gottschalkia acidurici (strain ATCC 7906 / DSM 604 / BCRC 14475 / CIP 104303 / KCTC 5404 / NCIMB 10678 / 9a) TaxID=1128398 RepID=K0AYJ2_GOTA9|nr:rhodanese-like domain-containing protein [Gottschalkia acidurici]AFS77810.1 rhodanese-like domain-containing protein [Gottschalkia acidurici 9a]
MKVSSVTNSELKAKMKINSVNILDVRKPEQFKENHIKDAISIPLEQLEENLDKLNKKDEINIICTTGKRATMASDILARNGFENISVVLPGMKSWE